MNNVLLIAGSRGILKLLSIPQVYHTFDNLSYVFDVQFDKIIHGGARGIDQLGGEWAKNKGYEVEVFPADWENSPGKSGGYLRNIQMAHSCTHAIIVWDGASKGTKHMFDLLNSMLIPTAMRVVGYG